MTQLLEKNGLWIGPIISQYAQKIARCAPDAMMTLGVFLYILAHRAYSGKWYGWTQIPVQYMATRGRVGFARLRAALIWLEGQEIIVPGSKQKYQARRYKVVLPTLGKRQKILKSTPKAVEGGPTTEIVFWSPLTATVEWQTVSSEYANSLSKCKQCGNYFDPTLGKHPLVSERCIACYIKDKIGIQGPGESKQIHLELEFGEYNWTVKKVNEFLKLVEKRVEKT